MARGKSATSAAATERIADNPATQGLSDVSLPADAGMLEIERRVLWLATNIVHHANRLRPNPSGLKVGGHQASSASMVTILTELFFDFLRAGDKVSVKPHASPVLHAIHYLLGNLDRSYLPRLRDYHGLQAYPSRTKDPDPVDFSTGSVGLGSVAPNFAALVDRFVQARFGTRSGPMPRFISVLGDAELDEGSVWEAVAEPALSGLDNLIWIVDLNRQSLDRVIPGIRVRQLEGMFRANGWLVVEAKYGRRLEQAFLAPRGEHLRKVLDEMANETYQYLLRANSEVIAQALGEATPDVGDAELRALISDLGGHDISILKEALATADRAQSPAVIFAYTIKGWGLPIAGDPLNHSALLTAEQIGVLRRYLQIPDNDEWPLLDDDSAGGRIVRKRRSVLRRPAAVRRAVPAIPADLMRDYTGIVSTQRAFGQIITAFARAAPEAADLLVTTSPDVATSTNLGGWINKVGVWEAGESPDIFSALGPRLIEWSRGPSGQHLELGISETNLLMLLGQLGLAGETTGQPLLPVGTLYDPFVARALDALIYGLYAGGRFVLVGTPSGVSLAPEGGAHQSVVTPAIGLATPGLIYWEPCFAQELEWILLDAIGRLHDPERAQASYLRLSTVPVDQALMPKSEDRDALRAAVLSGAYCMIDRTTRPGARSGNCIDIWATGITVPHALQASNDLELDGVYASVWNCVSPDVVYRRWQDETHAALQSLKVLHSPRRRPVVTVVDGHPSALSWIGSMLGARGHPLGVTAYGQSGRPEDLYREFRIDPEAICLAAYAALGG